MSCYLFKSSFKFSIGIDPLEKRNSSFPYTLKIGIFTMIVDLLNLMSDTIYFLRFIYYAEFLVRYDSCETFIFN